MRRAYSKVKFITPPAAIVDNTGYTTAAIDTKGAHLVEIYVLVGATDIAMAALKVQESEASDMTGAADVTGLVAGTSTLPGTETASALPSATDDNKVFRFEVNTQGRKRYLDLVATAGDGTAGTYLCAFALLHYNRERPNTDAKRGVAQTLSV